MPKQLSEIFLGKTCIYKPSFWLTKPLERAGPAYTVFWGINGLTARVGRAVRPSVPKNTGERKYGDLHLQAPGKPYFHTKNTFTVWLAKTGSTQSLSSSTQVPPPVVRRRLWLLPPPPLPPTPTAAGSAGLWMPCPTPGAVGYLGR